MPTEDRFDCLDLREEPAVPMQASGTDNTVGATCGYPSKVVCSDWCCTYGC